MYFIHSKSNPFCYEVSVFTVPGRPGRPTGSALHGLFENFVKHFIDIFIVLVVGRFRESNRSVGFNITDFR